jgi:hypothetical protein
MTHSNLELDSDLLQPKLKQPYKRMAVLRSILKLAGDEGFEPPIMGPEPIALPLGQSPPPDKVDVL